MNRKTLIQVLMFFLIFLISLLFYFKYFNKSPKNLQEKIIITKTSNDKNSSSSYIDYINYISNDTKGNRYQITAKQAEIDLDNPDTMFLEDVIAYIFMKESDTIKITSNFGKYNSKNYDTIFSKNVIITYPGHRITGDYSDFSFLKNLGTISTNVIYDGDNRDLFTDRIEINLTNKDTKIFMNDNSKKVLIKGTK